MESVPNPRPVSGDAHLALARESLRELLNDRRVPPPVRAALADDYQQLQLLLEKIEHGHIHIAVFGRVSVGKSALLNALLGETRFSTSPLHGETTRAAHARWQEYDAGGVFLIDTPGINEVAGEERERLAHDVATRSDLVLFVVDGDITDSELKALRQVKGAAQRLVLVLNKMDRYTRTDRDLLLQTLRARAAGLIQPQDILTAAAQPAERIVILVDAEGNETETRRQPAPDVTALRERIWDILKAEGKTMAALNAGLFAGRFSDRLTREIIVIRRDLAEKVVRNYCLAKGVAVALNPIPVADILAAIATDAAMVIHLSRVYGLPITRGEAGSLLKTISVQLAFLMGTVWVMNLVAAALKGISLGLSTVVTAGAQGAVAWYGTYVVGKAAEQYFAQGKSWGEGGPKRVVQDILDSLDRESLLAQARDDILSRLKPLL
ncbi:MAG: GTP-binding protein [Candidatus Contendobacter sp.]|nr:GTP-binding protein [Candidatus Contendobacter sp.]MDG4559208.1 GTP-binding protein [Candidatus Contendobacter sp.]